MMKIKLIAPREQREDTLSTPFKLQRANLPLLAALTPPGHTVTLVDEAFVPDDMNQDVDLVGITGIRIGTERNTEGGEKIKNLRIDFYEAMRRFHGEGFGILGAFVFGFDYEKKDVFEQTLEFIMRGRLDCVELRILTPFPGTRLYERLLREGRLFVRDWWLRGYPPDTLLFQPKGMTADELINGFAALNRQAYSFAGACNSMGKH